MKRKILIIAIIVVLFSVAIVVFTKMKFNHVNTLNFYKNGTYGFLSSENDAINDYDGMTYESMYNLKDFFVDDKVETLEQLENLSDYILIINTTQNPTFKGNGVINNCNVKKVIKGIDVKENQNIKIYDLVAFWESYGIFYLGGSTPLQKNVDYIVFLKKTANANTSNSYVFSTVKYGHVSISKEGNILENYEQNSLKLDEISKYDFVFSNKSSSEDISKYKSFYSEIFNKYREI